MRYLVLSDIHGNVHALDAVLEAAVATCDHVLVLGDLVGYGADPNGVIDRIRALDPLAVIRGNHDKVAAGVEPADDFNAMARQAAQWTAAALTAANREYLRTLPAGPTSIGDRFEICHGSPADEDQYIFDAGDAAVAFEAVQRPLCLFGHTHLPVVFVRDRRGLHGLVPGPESSVLEVEPDSLYLVNPGSVGQPRDGDPRAAFGVVDDEAGFVEIRRVEYRVDLAQAAIHAAGLPAALAHRLAAGR